MYRHISVMVITVCCLLLFRLTTQIHKGEFMYFIDRCLHFLSNYSIFISFLEKRYENGVL